MNFKTTLSFWRNLSWIPAIFCLHTACHAATMAVDTFSTNNLTGGTGWVGGWTGGNANNGQLSHKGNNPQTINRTFTAPTLTAGATGSPSGFFSIKADIKFDYQPSPPRQNYGFTTYQDGVGNGTFVSQWQRDTNGGQLTFLAGNGRTVIVPGVNWNIANTTTTNFTYTMIYDVTVLNGQNSNQYSGTYQAQIIRSDGLTYTTASLPWVDENKNLSNFQKIAFQNGSAQTTVGIDNVTLANTSQIVLSSPVPEPHAVGMLLVVSGLLLNRRQRRPAAVR